MLKLIKNKQFCQQCGKEAEILLECKPKLHKILSRLVYVDDLTLENLDNYKKETTETIQNEINTNNKRKKQINGMIKSLREEIKKEKDPNKIEILKCTAMEIKNFERVENELNDLSIIYDRLLSRELKLIGDTLKGQRESLRKFEEMYDYHAVELPYAIVRANMKNYAMFRDAQYAFKKTNLIVGGNASGKTLLLNALRGKVNEPNAKITISISARRKKNLGNFVECVLLDAPVSMLAKEEQVKFLQWLKNNLKGKQVIMTSPQELKGFENVINLAKN